MTKVQYYWSIFLRLAAFLLLAWALDYHPNGFYILLRLMIFGISIAMAYFSYLAAGNSKNTWCWAYIWIAVLFNPIFQVNLSREVWQAIDKAVAGMMIISLLFQSRSTNTAQQSDKDESPFGG